MVLYSGCLGRTKRHCLKLWRRLNVVSNKLAFICFHSYEFYSEWKFACMFVLILLVWPLVKDLKITNTDYLLRFAELMILGFISLLLTFGQTYISKICILDSVADTMLPCSIKTTEGTTEGTSREHRRRLLQNVLINQNMKRRILAAGSIESCPTVIKCWLGTSFSIVSDLVQAV